MRVSTIGSFLVLTVLLLHHQGNCNYAEVLWGQCYSFCLTSLESWQKKNGGGVGTNFIGKEADSKIHQCRRDRTCKWCLYACDRPRENFIELHICLDDCKNPRIQHRKEPQRACNASCEFISRSLIKYGTCPDPSDMVDFNAACVNECKLDFACDGMKKCCKNDCNHHVCQMPISHDVFPPKPGLLKFKERKDGGIVVEWDADNPIITPVVYVLRWWCPHSDVLRSITNKPRVKLKGHGHPFGIRPGAKCHFHVAAMNINGSRGFTEPQSYMKNILNPSPPLDLKTKRIRLHNDKVDVTIRWQPPLYTDGLPISRYLVFWSDKLPKASADYQRLHMHKKAVDADQLSYTVTDLDPGALIFIQVRAVVKWRDKTVKGMPVSTYIRAHSSPQPAIEAGTKFISEDSTTSYIYNVTIGEPVFYKSKLSSILTWSVRPGSRSEKYMLYWREDACEGESRHRKTRDRSEFEATSHKREFRLYNLQSDCLYNLKIYTVNYLGDKDGGVQEFFTTPPCKETKGQGSEMLCPLQIFPPSTPTALSVHFRQKSNCMCQAVLNWKRPDHRVNQFAILWGPSRAYSHGGGGTASSILSSSTIIYNRDPFKIQVPGNDSRACMTYLEKSQHYTAQVISRASKLKSSPAILHFTTPDNMAPCYEMGVGFDLTEKDNSNFLGSVKNPEENATAILVQTLSNLALPQHSSLLIVILCLFFAVIM